jgi:hypothetical protein
LQSRTEVTPRENKVRNESAEAALCARNDCRQPHVFWCFGNSLHTVHCHVNVINVVDRFGLMHSKQQSAPHVFSAFCLKKSRAPQRARRLR